MIPSIKTRENTYPRQHLKLHRARWTDKFLDRKIFADASLAAYRKL